VPEPIILPTIFNELLIVDALETNKLVKLVLLNIDVDVLFKLLIDNVEFVDNEFKLLNIVVDVAFKLLIWVVWLLIDNIELVDNEFKLLNIVVDVAFKLLIFNIELVDNEFKLLNIVVDVVFKLLIFDIELLDKLDKLVLYAYKLIPSGVDVIDVIVPWTELSELKFTVDIL